MHQNLLLFCCHLFLNNGYDPLSTMVLHRGHKHFLEFVSHNNHIVLEKMHTTKQLVNTLTAIFSEQFRTYLDEILPLTPTAELCASPTDNSTTMGILELGTLHES